LRLKAKAERKAKKEAEKESAKRAKAKARAKSKAKAKVELKPDRKRKLDSQRKAPAVRLKPGGQPIAATGEASAILQASNLTMSAATTSGVDLTFAPGIAARS
jgi:hypothetical protein